MASDPFKDGRDQFPFCAKGGKESACRNSSSRAFGRKHKPIVVQKNVQQVATAPNRIYILTSPIIESMLCTLATSD